MSVSVYIGFGSNLGDRFEHYQNTLLALKKVKGFDNVESSSLYLTEPLVKASKTPSQNEKRLNWYLNAVFCLQTALPLRDVFWILREIEKQSGRLKGKGTWQPRTVDLDLLFYGDVIYQDEDLQIPHVGIAKRKFVLIPLMDLNSNWMHPEFHMPVAKLLEILDDPLKVVPYAKEQFLEKV